jgi:transcription antitermination factor NusA-like protein
VCLKSNILCSGCGHKLKEGKISPLDVKVSRILFELARKHRGLGKINFRRAIEAKGLTVLLVGRGEISLVVGKGGKIIRKLIESLHSKVRVIEEGADIHKQVQDIVTPAKVRGINILYSSRGAEYRVRIPRANLKLLPASIDALQGLFAKLTDKNIKLVFE